MYWSGSVANSNCVCMAWAKSAANGNGTRMLARPAAASSDTVDAPARHTTRSAAAKADATTAEAELTKWGDKAQDGDYANLVARAGWGVD